MSVSNKIKSRWILVVGMLMATMTSFGQELSDREIGFDADRIAILFKERGGVKSEDLQQEIERMRELSKEVYKGRRKAKSDFFESLKSDQEAKKLFLRSGAAVDIPKTEKDVLLAFSQVIGQLPGWDFSTPVTSFNETTGEGWYGITVANGRVASIDLNNHFADIQPLIENLSFFEDLVSLDLAGFGLTGPIPSQIFKLKKLRRLDLSGNAFAGTISAEISELAELQFLDLSGIELSGPEQSEIWKLKDLKYLNLLGCVLSGPIPSEIFELKGLKQLYLPGNDFTGSISPAIGGLKELEYLILDSNYLTGPIPSEIGDLKELRALSLSFNQLAGPMPSRIGELAKLEGLILFGNLLTGPIPPEIGKLTELFLLDLAVNQLSGPIPAEIGHLKHLRWLFLSINELTGPVPRFEGNFSLNITDNKFRFIDIGKLPFNGNFSPQRKTDEKKTISIPLGRPAVLKMFEDDRFLADDTFQWYKNGVPIAGATDRIFTVSSLKAEDLGTYFCRSRNPEMQSLVLEREPIILSVGEEELCETKSEIYYTNEESNFVFETKNANLAYKWSVSKDSGEAVSACEPNSTGIYSYTFAKEGNYIINLLVTDANGCESTFSKPVQVADRHCINIPINLMFEGEAGNLSYKWTVTNACGTVVNEAATSNGLYAFKPEKPGEYEIKVLAGEGQKCETLFSRKIFVGDCLADESCAEKNPYAAEIQRLFVSMINKLATAPDGEDVNLHAKKEIAALSPYIKVSNAKIYNFASTGTELSFSFSEAGNEKDVQLPKASSGFITGIDLSRYEDAHTKSSVTAKFSDGSDSKGYVKNIDFCAPELSCVSHVALVVDESGSIDLNQANKIKKQLKLFIEQQAQTNDAIGSNIYVSLTGMSDSDENTRRDFILPTKVANTPESLKLFNGWIDSYGKRNGKTGISTSSDYWRSGLEGALGYSMKPNMVVMITDGCQTADVKKLKETMKKFNNASGSDPKAPHLYVVGTETGFYIDESFYSNSQQPEDPNNPQSSVANTVTVHLAKSLKYLLDLPAEFPKADMNDFSGATYYGHKDFSLLAADETYFSDKLISSGVICGTPSAKDFCDDCVSFQPEPGKEYMLSAWVKEELPVQVKTYENHAVKVVFYDSKEALDQNMIDSLDEKASGNIIDGWQRIVLKFRVPLETVTIGIELENSSSGIPAYFDDIRIYPLQGSMKSFVYDPETFKLMSELDENNYSTFYEYDNEGGLVRIKKETEKGIKTIQETRSGSVISTNP